MGEIKSFKILRNGEEIILSEENCKLFMGRYACKYDGEEFWAETSDVTEIFEKPMGVRTIKDKQKAVKEAIGGFITNSPTDEEHDDWEHIRNLVDQALKLSLRKTTIAEEVFPMFHQTMTKQFAKLLRYLDKGLTIYNARTSFGFTWEEVYTDTSDPEVYTLFPQRYLWDDTYQEVSKIIWIAELPHEQEG